MDGICTLANDSVYDQLVALINSIEANAGRQMPICIYPYDDRLDRVRQLVEERPQVQLYCDRTSLAHWDSFVEQVWATHPTARQQWQAIGSRGIHRQGTHRRFCAFDGPFDRFLYMDADTLLIGPVAPIFQALDTCDWVIYDYQHKDLTHVFTVAAPQFEQLFSTEQMRQQAFCSGFYAARRGTFKPDQLGPILAHLQQGEAEVLYPMAPDQTILNYLVMRSGLKSCNLALTLPPGKATGNSVTSTHFTTEAGQVYDRGMPLTYLHYIGVSSQLFRQLCAGENVDFPYREVFLHYRYRHDPSSRPRLVGRLKPYQSAPGWRRYLSALTRQLTLGKSSGTQR
ncbi:MAG: sugar transferase [Cyanobacteria bacterium Co-bin13]|nr:sugar transferase [Cyanobacteria bacterium Co-bin13]